MVTLTGENLGKRQQEFNLKVSESIVKNVDFEKMKAEANASDLDKLYVIDVASKYKNINHIIEVLKDGDSLYISRALKCNWLYNDDFSSIINTDYLHHNIFPFMSLKMKRKFLISISMYLRNERAASFYTYCINSKLYNIAFKFLIFTSESFKLDVIQGSSALLNKIAAQEGHYISFLIGNSFLLAKAYMVELNEYQRSRELYKLRYLFSVSNTEYLDLLEKYQEVEKIYSKFGLRISKQILTKHKHRCLQHPFLYMNILNKSTVTKYLTVDITKIITVTLLPSKVDKFWNECYCTVYEFILNTIPASERFQWLKNIFNDKYPGQEFEMTKEFFTSECYKFMTPEERETWALRHIESKKEIQGDGCVHWMDYLWYKFVSFNIAFPEVKKYIMKTKDYRTREQIVKVLIESARNQRELEKLLYYYQDRHMNEAKHIKESFVRHIIDNHSLFNFDHECWVAFNKILYNLDVYNFRGNRCKLSTFAALVYNIIHEIDIPEGLQKYIECELCWSIVSADKLYSNVSKEHQKAVYQYLLQFYKTKMAKIEDDVTDENCDKIKNKYTRAVLDLLEEHKKSMDDCPEIFKAYIESNIKEFRYYTLVQNMNKFTVGDIIRLLKQDAKNVIDKISDVRRMIRDDDRFKMNSFLKKIKIYFHDDINKYYLNCFIEMISEKDLSMKGVYTAVYGIFQLADEQFKEEFMAKYAPSDPKIDYTKMDTHTLYIQGGICRFACFSRPPVPPSNILVYIAGDYVQHCLPIFNTYLANLPIPLCIEFTKSIIETPVSVQKHGIHLAFKSFDTENLKKLVGDLWQKTKNVSLRLIIYRNLYNKIVDGDETLQLELFETLKAFTSELHEDDLSDIYNLLGSRNLPENLLSEYLPVAWQTVQKFTDTSANVKRKTAVILSIGWNLRILDAMFIKSVVEGHITDQLFKTGIKNCYEIPDLEYLYDSKWELVTAYMIYFVNDKDLLLQNIELANLIIKKCVEMWNTVQDEIFIWRRFCWNFIALLIERRLNNGSYEDAIPIYERVLLGLQESLPLHVIYLKCWLLRLTIIGRKFTEAGKLKFDKESKKDNKIAVIKEAIQNFAHAAGELVKQSVEDKVYFHTYISDIVDMIYSNVHGIKYGINFNYEVSIDYDDYMLLQLLAY